MVVLFFCSDKYFGSYGGYFLACNITNEERNLSYKERKHELVGYKGHTQGERTESQRLVATPMASACPLPLKGPPESDLSLAKEGDRMAKARIAVNKNRMRKRNEEIERWEQVNGPAPWREYPDLVSGIHGAPIARLTSPRGDPTRYVCVVVRPACAQRPRGYCIAGVGLSRTGLPSCAL